MSQEASERLVDEFARRVAVANVNAAAAGETAEESRARVEAQYGRAWSTDELCEEFEAIGFAAPLVIVRRRADGKLGTLTFQHHPRLYFNFQED